MKRFLNKILYFLLLGAIPIPFILWGYFYFDPFKVLKNYSDFSYPNIVPNRDYISTQSLLNRKSKYAYNSFIFGSSRTLAYKANSWKAYLPPSAVPYLFDASAESIYGIYTKIKFLDSLKIPINNALVIICRDVTFDKYKNPSGHLYIKHPAVSGENKIWFHLEFINAYIRPRFLLNFYSFQFLKSYKPFMAGYIENRKITYDTISNQLNILSQEEEITANSERYYSTRENLFYQRKGEQTATVNFIDDEHLYMLEEIKAIFEKNHTNYKIVISPLYEQVKFSPKDFGTLQKYFTNHLFDFSGKNNFTDDFHNYYETSHYRPVVGDSIMHIIYTKQE